MSVDGTGLFDDDTAHDVREQFTKLLADTQEAAIATEKLVAEWEDSLQRSDEGPVFWLALAATQWRYGCLQPQVAARALEVILSGSDLARWRGSPHEQRRVAVLRRFQKQLTRPQPAFRLPKPRKERVPAQHAVESPDGHCQAQAINIGQRRFPRSDVLLLGTDGAGPYVFDAECDYRQIQLQWLGPAMLEIAYPAEARVLLKQTHATVGGREIAVVIRRY
jgi:hypothetical protein